MLQSLDTHQALCALRTDGYSQRYQACVDERHYLPIYRCSVHGQKRIGAACWRHTAQRVSEPRCEPLGLTPEWWEWAGAQSLGCVVGLGGERWGEGSRLTARGWGQGMLLLLPGEGRGWHPPREGRPCKEAEIIVSTVPNPKWLRPSCNPIKVRLVYLSSSGLFIWCRWLLPWGGSAAPCQPPAAQS